MRPHRGLKASYHRGHVFFFKLAAGQVLVFDLIAGSYKVNLLKTGQDFSEAGNANANPGLKLIRVITFSSIQTFFAAWFCVNKTQNRKPHRKVTEFKSKCYLFLG